MSGRPPPLEGASLIRRWRRRLLGGLRRTGAGFGLDRALACLLLVVLVLVRIIDPLPVEALRLRAFDAYQILQPRQAASLPVTIVDIDEASLAALGQWPWPRTRIAEMIDRLHGAGALLVGFDIVFAEPDRMSLDAIAKTMPDIDPQLRSRLEALPSNDAVMAAALRRMPTVLGETALAMPTKPQPGLPLTGFATRGPPALPFLHRYPGLLTNIAVLEQAAPGRGLFSIAPENDGIVRRVPMLLAAEGRLRPSLTLDILRLLTGAGAVLVRTDATGIISLALPGLAIPVDANGQVWVHYTGHDPRRFVSAKALLDGTAPASRFSGKIVLIGTSAIGLLDDKTTPLSRSMPGVEVHTQVLESVLAGALLHEPHEALAIEACITLLIGAAIIALAPLLGPVVLLLFGAAVAALLAGISWWAYAARGTLIDASFPLLANFVVYAMLAFVNYLRAQIGRRRIRLAFSQYLSPDLVAELARSSQSLTLGGETRLMSIMFSDVRGFTGISESYKHDPQGLTRLMNRFLTPLTNAIIEHKGTIDKYMGDAIMAFWNAPLRDDDQEGNACRAALDMLKRLETLNAEREAEAAAAGAPFRALDVGIGINTGTCVVGNMGSDLRFDYSVLGDAVNLASRLEGQSKSYGIRIILGDSTARAVAASFAVLEIDLLQVKGKSEPQAVWTLLGADALLAADGFRTLAPVHADMMERYRGRDFAAAALLVERCRALGAGLRGEGLGVDGLGLAGLYDLYAERIAAFLLAPPPADWTGVYAATSK